MVLAEIPLWITHSNEAVKSGTTEQSSSSSSARRDGVHAMASLGLWRKDRAAIYAVHLHPHQPLIATGGGDGTVRIFSTSTLFASQHLGGRFANKKEDDEQEEGEAADKAADNNNNPNKTTSYVSTSSSSEEDDRAANGGAGGPSSDEDEKMSHATSSSLDNSRRGDNTTTTTMEQQQPIIHDLSNVVRSRKHPDQAPSPERPLTATTAPAAGGAFPSSPSPPQQQQRLLCTLSAHTGSSVLAVRFSSNGKLLASAGDDGCVCLYAPDTATTPTTSLWHRILLCRGHNLDAVGLAWSPDDSYLVSVSLDRETPILVWKVADVVASGHAPTGGSMIRTAFKVLGRTEHTSTVKGVCFDPVGSYICTSGDDPAICIWRTHGDWGLEQRIDAKDGIFRQWGTGGAGGAPLSTQSLFRRLSWSTDGMHILSTNATNKNKHVASTISREQWACAGSASLVGHKQPVVVAQHAPVLLAVVPSNNSQSNSNDPDEEPDYATLVALGDKKGFVTIWSTRKSRPLFKLQCSEGRSTVTDMAWGVADDHLLLAVALLDGHVVVLRLGIPDELGPLLSTADQAKLFRLRYGIDTNDPSSYGRLMDDTRPKLIETALQMTLEEDHDEDEDEDHDDTTPPPAPAAVNQLMGRSKKDGKKRVQPLLVTQQKPLSPPPAKRTKTAKPPPTDALENAKQVADKAAAAAKTAAPTTAAAPNTVATTAPLPSPARMPPPPPTALAATSATTAATLSYSTERVHSVELAVESGLLAEEKVRWTAECQNRHAQVPLGSKGPGLPCLDVSLQRDGRPVWHDQIVGTSCSAVAGNERLFAVGMVDGTLQLYGASPVSGWRGETAVRAFPPIVLGQAIVTLQIKTWEERPTLLVVTADGTFGVYRLEPTLAKVLRGSVFPAMMHMANASLQEEKSLPKMSRCQLTDKGQILLLLSSSGASISSSTAVPNESRGRSTSHGVDASASSSVGGSIQGFVYHRDLELWLRVSDSRFVLSDFYSSLPLRKSAREQGPLHQLDDAVRLGAMEAAIKPSQRKRQDHSASAATMFAAATDGGNFVPTKAHCEDRLACAIALNSSSDFRKWLGLYSKTLAVGGQEALLRTLMDALLGDDGGWWLCTGLDAMGLDRKELLKKVVMPAMSKNRALQRLTNELAVELDS